MQDDAPAHAGHTRQQPSAAERERGHAGPADHNKQRPYVFVQIMNNKIKHLNLDPEYNLESDL